MHSKLRLHKKAKGSHKLGIHRKAILSLFVYFSDFSQNNRTNRFNDLDIIVRLSGDLIEYPFAPDGNLHHIQRTVENDFPRCLIYVD